MPDQIQEQKPAQPDSEAPHEAAPEAAKEEAKGVAEETASALRHLGDTTAETIKKPTTAAAIAGAAVVASAVAFGLLETVVGGAAAYLAYRLLRQRRSEATAH